MKKKLKSILKILSILFILIIPFALLMTVRADAGWDTDYDVGGGGGWDSGGWDSGGWSSSDSNWSSSHYYDSGTDLMSTIIVFIIVFIIVLCVAQALGKNKPAQNIKSKYMRFADPSYQDMDEDKLKEIVPDMSIGNLKNMVYHNFVDVQNAWMEFDYDKLRELCTDELFNTYKAQLETLKLKFGKNIMTAFDLVDIKITDAIVENDSVILTAYMCINFYDYVINTKTKETIRGSMDRMVHNNYILTFVRSSNIEEGKENKCPNCGAPIKDKASEVCEYCGSTIVKDSETFVLSKKNIIK